MFSLCSKHTSGGLQRHPDVGAFWVLPRFWGPAWSLSHQLCQGQLTHIPIPAFEVIQALLKPDQR